MRVVPTKCSDDVRDAEQASAAPGTASAAVLDGALAEDVEVALELDDPVRVAARRDRRVPWPRTISYA